MPGLPEALDEQCVVLQRSPCEQQHTHCRQRVVEVKHSLVQVELNGVRREGLDLSLSYNVLRQGTPSVRVQRSRHPRVDAQLVEGGMQAAADVGVWAHGATFSSSVSSQ